MNTRRFASSVSSSVVACRCTMPCSRAFSSAIAACAASDFASVRVRASKLPLAGQISSAISPTLSSSSSTSLSGRPLAARPSSTVTRPSWQHASAGGAGRLHRRVQDHRQQLVRVVRRGERVADERDGVLVARAAEHGDGRRRVPASAQPRSRAPDRHERERDREQRPERAVRERRCRCRSAASRRRARRSSAGRRGSRRTCGSRSPAIVTSAVLSTGALLIPGGEPAIVLPF